MPRLSLWNNRKQNDYKFFDRIISEQFKVGGTAFLVHKYIGIHEQDPSDDETQPNYADDVETNIQDLLLLENRDRKYDENVYELRGHYNVQDHDFDLSQFGLFLTNDVIYLECHLNDMIDVIGRKVMSGDVIELPHRRDDTLLPQDADDEFGPVIPKLFKVEDTDRASSGYSPTWWPHIWRIKISPLTDSQEYRDIIGDGDQEDDLRHLISTWKDEIRISEAIISEAENQVPYRNLEHAHLYVMPDAENALPYLFMTDGIPPNGADLVDRGHEFPDEPNDGDWFLRTDYQPNVLFQRNGNIWERKEVDFRKKWSTANRILEKFVNNRKKVELQSGEEIDSKVAISKAIASKKRPDTDY